MEGNCTQRHHPLPGIYSAVTTGTEWKTWQRWEPSRETWFLFCIFCIGFKMRIHRQMKGKTHHRFNVILLIKKKKICLGDLKVPVSAEPDPNVLPKRDSVCFITLIGLNHNTSSLWLYLVWYGWFGHRSLDLVSMLFPWSMLAIVLYAKFHLYDVFDGMAVWLNV